MNEEERKEIEGYLVNIGKILIPFIKGVTNEDGVIFRAHLEKYEYGPFLESYLDMVSFLNPELEYNGTLRLVPNSKDKEETIE